MLQWSRLTRQAETVGRELPAVTRISASMEPPDQAGGDGNNDETIFRNGMLQWSRLTRQAETSSSLRYCSTLVVLQWSRLTRQAETEIERRIRQAEPRFNGAA